MAIRKEIHAEVAATVAAASTALRDRLASTDAEIAQVEARLSELREERNYVASYLRRVAPDQAPQRKRARADRGARVSDEKVERVRQYITTYADAYADGIVASAIYQDMKTDPLDDEPPIGRLAIGEALAALHDQGILRADRKVAGGGTAYKLVGRSQ